MNPFYYIKGDLKHIVETLKNSEILQDTVVVVRDLPIKLRPDIIILDLETTGIVPKESEMICYGYVYSDKAYVTCRLMGPEKNLIESLYNKLLSMLCNNDVIKIYAFCCEFERNWVLNKFEQYGLDTKVLNITFEELKKEAGRLKDIIPWNFNDKYSGEDIPRLWNEWKERLSFGCLSSIIWHNLADLYRELILYLKNELK